MQLTRSIGGAGVLTQMTCLGTVDAHPRSAVAPAHNLQQYPFYLDLSAATQLREPAKDPVGETTFDPGFTRRDEVVIGTKYPLYNLTTNGRDPNAGGNHRKNLLRSVEGSLRRLRTDYIDLLWIHIADLNIGRNSGSSDRANAVFGRRGDERRPAIRVRQRVGTRHLTPVDEVLRMMDALVRSGKALYIGALNFPAWWADSWSYRECLPYFKRSEEYYAGSSEFHGGDGPIPVRQNPKPTAVATAFCEAAVELGFDGPNWDHNGARQEDGAGLYTHTIFPDGTRASTAQTYVELARRTGRLRLISNAQAPAILFDRGRAAAVRYLRDGREQDIRASCEVMVCGGAFHSPHLLMASGIGDAVSLRALGIRVHKHLPGVGKNLQDHLLQPIFFHSRQELPIPQFIAEAGLFVRTRPGMQAVSPNLGAGLPAFTPPGLGANFLFLPILVQPLSRGEVKLKSANLLDLPIIEPNYLAEPEDTRTLAAGVQLTRRLAKTRAMSARDQRRRGGAGRGGGRRRPRRLDPRSLLYDLASGRELRDGAR